MWQALSTTIGKYFLGWLKSQFKGNPLIENTSEYLAKAGASIQVGIIAMVSIIAFGFLLYTFMIVAVVKGWL